MKIEMLELKDTVKLMNSGDYKDRFIAEYLQLEIRTRKLKAMLDKWNEGKLPFTPTCPYHFLAAQLQVMEDLLTILKARAKLEEIDLDDVDGGLGNGE